MVESQLPAVSGTYVLLLEVTQPLSVQVGRLGTIHLAPGWHVYVGSAHGPGGLRARLCRHLRTEKPIHWHIDVLTAVVPVAAIWLDVSPQRLECAWARTVAALPGVSIPLAGFGSSDCACEAHLFALADVDQTRSALGNPQVVYPGGETCS